MSKVGIVTLWGNANYGNRLQNFATERLISQQGLEPYTLTIPLRKASRLFQAKSKIVERLRTPRMNARRKRFDAFNERYLHPVDYFFHEKCDAFLCGSDQVWNYTFPEFSSEMFLSFSNGKPTCALSASFGVSEIPANLKPIYSDYISKIDYISVRERAGAELVRIICNREAEVLIDPTMALGRDEWDRIKTDFTMPDKPYVFTYFIGERPRKLNERIARELGYSSIISFNDITCPNWFDADPLTFVGAIAHADVVVTDSFHGVAFSIIYEKPFIVFERNTSEKSMASRIDTILDTFKMESNRLSNLNCLDECTKPGMECQLILENEKLKVGRFLTHAFERVAR